MASTNEPGRRNGFVPRVMADWAWGEASELAPGAMGDTVSECAPGVMVDCTVATGRRD